MLIKISTQKISADLFDLLLGALLSPTRSNISKEEEALKLAIEQVNEDTRNYPGIKLRSLIRYADPDIDFDNIEKGKEKLCSNRRQ